MNAHAKRWITGILAVPIVILIIIWGSKLVFSLFIAILAIGAVFEYHKMVFNEGHQREKIEGLILALCIMAATYTGDARFIFAVVTLSMLVIFMLFLFRARTNLTDLDSLFKVVFGLLYVPLMLSHFIQIRGFEQGVRWIFFLVIIAFATDISAFYVGRTWGKRKLMPHVSAGKTVEGAIGGLAGSVIGCVLYALIFFQDMSMTHAVVMGFFGSIMGQLGDLCESSIKRASGVKDSGIILPGHGGILDRLDSLIFIAPFVYYYAVFVIS